MSLYFTKFPTVSYNGISVRDITRRSVFINNLLSNPYVFLPYTIKEGEKPEDIAFNYYGTVEATWLVLLANNIVDPYNQWPMSQDVLHEFISLKYQEQSNLTGSDVVYWTQDETILDNILYYYNKTDSGLDVRVSVDTFPYTYDNQNNITGRNIPEGWKPMRIYEYEVSMNEARRDILVVEKNYYTQVRKEFERVIRL